MSFLFGPCRQAICFNEVTDLSSPLTVKENWPANPKIFRNPTKRLLENYRSSRKMKLDNYPQGKNQKQAVKYARTSLTHRQKTRIQNNVQRIASPVNRHYQQNYQWKIENSSSCGNLISVVNQKKGVGLQLMQRVGLQSIQGPRLQQKQGYGLQLNFCCSSPNIRTITTNEFSNNKEETIKKTNICTSEISELSHQSKTETYSLQKNTQILVSSRKALIDFKYVRAESIGDSSEEGIQESFVEQYDSKVQTSKLLGKFSTESSR